MSEVNVINRRS